MSALAGLSVLVVEDDADGREILELVLQGQGAVVRSVDTAAAALAILGSWRPCILLGDISMPGEDGYAFLARARALHPVLPAIAVTGHASSADIDRALAAGYDDHVTKPIDVDALVASIARLATPQQTPSDSSRADT
jgi:CheY-like chemotaxis protein